MKMSFASHARWFSLWLLLVPMVVYGQFSYTTNNGTITITGFTGAGEVTIPSTINGLPVTAIGSSAFVSAGLTNINIPDTVTNIGDHAFYLCANLRSVTIPNGVTSIEDSTFSNCISLTNATIPNTVTSIRGSAFSYCISLSNIALPNGLTNISGFSDCWSLLSITIPYGITHIPRYAFTSCTSLTNVVIPESVTTIDSYAFDGCTNLPDVTIPSGVTIISSYVFNDCTSLTNVIIPEGVVYVAEGAFRLCSRLTAVYFQGSAPNFEPTAFAGDRTSIYYLPGTAGWTSSFAGLPTALWILPYPVVLRGSLGVQNGQFGFVVSWATNVSVIVEAGTSPSNPNWQPLQTNTLSGGSFYFSDPLWANYPDRFYRVRWR